MNALPDRLPLNCRRLLLLFMGIALLAPLCAQNYYFDNYMPEDGLSSSKVYCILQDQQDYIWLGTESGLSRFDGIYFDNYTSKDGLADHGVKCIYQDTTNGYVWFGHLHGGITRFDGNRFQVFNYDTLKLNGDITSIEICDGQLWFTTLNNGAIRIEKLHPKKPQFEKYQQYRGKDGLSDMVIRSYKDRAQQLFCMADVGVKKYDADSNRFVNYVPYGLDYFYFSVIDMLQDSKGRYWFGTYHGGLYNYNPEAKSIKVYDRRDGLANNWVTTLHEDREGNIWAGTWGGGISRISDGKLQNFTTSNGLSALQILDIEEDREGNILISSYSQGMHIYKGSHFISIDDDKILSDKNIWAINKDEQGRYWLGTNAGITILDYPKQKIVEEYNYESNAFNNVRFIKKDAQKNFWIGTEGNGLYQFIVRKGRFVSQPYIDQYLDRSMNIKALESDNFGNVWVGSGSDNGLLRWNVNEQQGEGYSQRSGLAGNYITSIYCDPMQVIWVGSEQKQGLSKYDRDNNQFVKIELPEEIIPQTMVMGTDSVLWVGTSQGLYAIRDERLYFYLSEQDGLLSNNIKSLVTDTEGNLYIGSPNGLNILVNSTKKIYTYTQKTGFTGVETKPNATFADADGKVWMGTSNGITIVNPENLWKYQSQPITHLRSMLVNYDTVALRDDIRLTHKKNNIDFHYYSISLKNPDALLYKVMLEGADPDWRYTHQQSQTYAGLKPGHYAFVVMAQNSDGVWSDPDRVDFVINPPYYQTWWFLSICFMLAAIGVFAYIKQREQNLIREKTKLEEMVKIRTAEVVAKSEELELKNKDIMASIRYAERIQKALLPSEEFDVETFVMFRPKEHVSGDFYWMYHDGERTYIAAVDCTGHGVPGAFMSIIGHDSLNKIIKEHHVAQPAAILDQLNTEVYKTLIHGREDDIKDGMDLALLTYNSSQRKLEFAGAHNPLYLMRNGDVEEIKADRFAIGKTSVFSGNKFTNNVIDVQPGDIAYILSDWYADQFGGDEGKKFKKVNLRKEFIRVHDLPMQQQKAELEKTFNDWKGCEEQIDDVLVIGIKF